MKRYRRRSAGLSRRDTWWEAMELRFSWKRNWDGKYCHGSDVVNHDPEFREILAWHRFGEDDE